MLSVLSPGRNMNSNKRFTIQQEFPGQVRGGILTYTTRLSDEEPLDLSVSIPLSPGEGDTPTITQRRLGEYIGGIRRAGEIEEEIDPALLEYIDKLIALCRRNRELINETRSLFPFEEEEEGWVLDMDVYGEENEGGCTWVKRLTDEVSTLASSLYLILDMTPQKEGGGYCLCCELILSLDLNMKDMTSYTYRTLALLGDADITDMDGVLPDIRWALSLGEEAIENMKMRVMKQRVET